MRTSCSDRVPSALRIRLSAAMDHPRVLVTFASGRPVVLVRRPPGSGCMFPLRSLHAFLIVLTSVPSGLGVRPARRTTFTDWPSTSIRACPSHVDAVASRSLGPGEADRLPDEVHEQCPGLHLCRLMLGAVLTVTGSICFRRPDLPLRGRNGSSSVSPAPIRLGNRVLRSARQGPLYLGVALTRSSARVYTPSGGRGADLRGARRRTGALRPRDLLIVALGHGRSVGSSTSPRRCRSRRASSRA